MPDPVDVAGTPALLPLYARAVLPKPGGDAVPTKSLRLQGVRPTTDGVAAYADVCGFRLGSTLPPTYPHLLGFRLQLALMADRAFPFPATGLVHVANDLSVLATINVGDPLDVTVHAEGPHPHRRGRTVDLVTEVTRGGEPVWRSTSTYLRRGPAQPGANPADAGTGRSDVQPDADLPASAVWRLPADLGRRYAAVSGDRNPIHLWPLTARLFGFKRPIAHGMWTAAASVAALEGRLPERCRIAVEFKAPVLLPATVELGTAVEPDGAARLVLRSRRSGRPHLLGRVDPLS